MCSAGNFYAERAMKSVMQITSVIEPNDMHQRNRPIKIDASHIRPDSPLYHLQIETL